MPSEANDGLVLNSVGGSALNSSERSGLDVDSHVSSKTIVHGAQSTVYTVYRLDNTQRKNTRYDLRPRVTKAICNKFVGSRGDIIGPRHRFCKRKFSNAPQFFRSKEFVCKVLLCSPCICGYCGLNVTNYRLHISNGCTFKTPIPFKDIDGITKPLAVNVENKYESICFTNHSVLEMEAVQVCIPFIECIDSISINSNGDVIGDGGGSIEDDGGDGGDGGGRGGVGGGNGGASGGSGGDGGGSGGGSGGDGGGDRDGGGGDGDGGGGSGGWNGEDDDEDNGFDGNNDGVRVRGISNINDIYMDLGDGSISRVRKCNSRHGCLTCPVLSPCDYIVSSVTHRKYKVINHDLDFCDCSSSNLIYLIICDKCGVQYVGQTAQQLRKRISKHRNDIARGRGSCPFLIKHFNKGNCKGANFHVQVVEKFIGTGRTNGAVDASLVSSRRDRETEWMLKLRTVFPYGLNHDTGSNFEHGDNVVGITFPKLSTTIKQTHFHGRNNRGIPNNFNIDTFCNDLRLKLATDIHNVSNYLRISISGLKKCHLKRLHNHITTSYLLPSHDHDPYEHFYHLAIDMIDTKLYKPPPERNKRKPPRYKLTIPFTNKAFDYINLPSILRSDACSDVFPNFLVEDDIPMVVFKLQPPIRSSIFNYSKFVSSLDLKAANDNIETIPCHCHLYADKYVDNHHHHILTGDRSIINNTRLRDLIGKGPKFREPTGINFDDALMHIDVALDNYIESLSNIKKVDISSFSAWKKQVIDAVQSKSNVFKPKFTNTPPSSVLGDPLVKSELKVLHDRFVFCPIDKAANNVAIICKQFYVSVILKELNFHLINDPSQNNTYELVQGLTAEDIVETHTTAQAALGHECKEEIQKLPPMHWTPKMHKTPVGARFIIGSKCSSLKPLGGDITRIFKVIFHHKRRYYRKAGFFSGLNNFWCVDKSSDITSTLDRFNRKGKAYSVSSFDFSTLYTKIPHDKLIDVLSKLVDSTFNDTTREFMSVGTNRAYWVKGVRGKKFKYDANTVKECLSFLIKNAYFRVGNLVFRQIIGIPMGSDPAPFFANLFLFYYECKWIKKLSKEDYGRARRLHNIFRFIDDLLAINDHGEFGKSFMEIYPPELILNKENISDLKTTFLDLLIEILGNQFLYRLYDKRDAFPFHIVRFPFLCSNLPSKMFYSTISAEILRICRASLSHNDFLLAASPFLQRMKSQGAKKESVKGSLHKLFARHFSSFTKYGLQKEEVLNNLMDLL